MSLNFHGLNGFITKQQITKKMTSLTQTAKQTTTEEGEWKPIVSKERVEDYVKTAKESADKIKEMTRELENLKLSENKSEAEINSYVAKINSLKAQANELYNILSNYGVGTRCKEYDEFYHAYVNFEQLAENKLAQAGIIGQPLKGQMSSSTLLEYIGTLASVTPNIPQTTTEGEWKPIVSKEMVDDYVKTSKESADKIKELIEKLNDLKLSSRPAKDEIDNYIAQINSMKTQAGELYDILSNYQVGTRCKEYDEFYHAYENFLRIAENKLASAEVAKQQTKGQISEAALLEYMKTFEGITTTTQQTTTKGEWKPIVSKEMVDDYVKTSKESADKIKEMIKELEKLEISENLSATEINSYVSKINSLKVQANELYNILSNYGVGTRCKEYDEFYHAYVNFEQLAQKKLSELNK